MWSMGEVVEKVPVLKEEKEDRSECCYLLLQAFKYREEHRNEKGKMLIFANRMGKGVTKNVPVHCCQNWFLRHVDKEEFLKLYQRKYPEVEMPLLSTPPLIKSKAFCMVQEYEVLILWAACGVCSVLGASYC